MLMAPELIVSVGALVVLLLDLMVGERNRRFLAPASMCILLAAILTTILAIPRTGAVFGGQFTMDAVAWWFKLLFLLSGFIIIPLSMNLLDGKVTVRVRGIGSPGEFYALLLSTLVGMMCLISARDIVTLYVSLELATIPLFVLAAWRRDDAQSGEAGLKYVILGALASSLILYGLGVFYGLSGQMDLAAIGKVAHDASPAFYLAAALVLAGVGFKLTIVPFHMWAADVYQGAPTPVTAYLSVASKGAGLAFMFQFFFRMVDPAGGHWLWLIAILAAVTMTLGNLVAIVQNNIKRFMAFSAISQAGYLILGFLGPAAEGVPAMLFYMLVYIASNLAVFGCIIWYSNETGREQIPEYRGLSRTNPLMALAMMIALFSLAGIPPLSGFVGKFFLFSIASRAGLHWLVALAAVNSTVSLYYYLRIVRQMYIESPDEGAQRLPANPSLAVTVGVLAVATVLLGLIPGFYQTIHTQTITWLAMK